MYVKTQKRRKGLSFVFGGIIFVLAILLFTPKLWTPGSRGKIKDAYFRIAELEGALRLFSLDTSRYPTTSEGLQALVRAPEKMQSWKGPYLIKPGILNDPWDRPYIYRCPGQHGAYDIFSYGRDGIEGGEGEDADIAIWQK
jgi:general secretion pathway protein G